MSESRDLVVIITKGAHDEMASVGLTMACGGMTAGMKVMIFLSGPGVEIALANRINLVESKPLDPLKMLVDDFLARGGQLLVCTPCAKARGLEQSDFVEGSVVSGAGPMHELIKNGAGTISL